MILNLNSYIDYLSKKIQNNYFLKSIFQVMLFFLSLSVMGQKGVIVTYEEFQIFSTSITRLSSNGELSIYKSVEPKAKDQSSLELKKIISNMEKNSIYLVKDYKNNTILYPAQHVFDSKKQIISDSLNTIKWKIVSNNPTTKYLGRNVKMAKCRFRERNYTALYCPDIPISDGPFKFNGLPGLILKITSDDNMFSFLATKIEFTEKAIVNVAPKYFSNQIQFWTYVKMAKKQMAEDYKQFLSTLPPDQRNNKLDVKIERIEMVF
ncbi:MAG: GLPGLI family protein [Aquirufa sp.]